MSGSSIALKGSSLDALADASDSGSCDTLSSRSTLAHGGSVRDTAAEAPSCMGGDGSSSPSMAISSGALKTTVESLSCSGGDGGGSRGSQPIAAPNGNAPKNPAGSLSRLGADDSSSRSSLSMAAHSSSAPKTAAGSLARSGGTPPCSCGGSDDTLCLQSTLAHGSSVPETTTETPSCLGGDGCSSPSIGMLGSRAFKKTTVESLSLSGGDYGISRSSLPMAAHSSSAPKTAVGMSEAGPSHRPIGRTLSSPSGSSCDTLSSRSTLTHDGSVRDMAAVTSSCLGGGGSSPPSMAALNRSAPKNPAGSLSHTSSSRGSQPTAALIVSTPKTAVESLPHTSGDGGSAHSSTMPLKAAPEPSTKDSGSATSRSLKPVALETSLSSGARENKTISGFVRARSRAVCSSDLAPYAHPTGRRASTKPIRGARETCRKRPTQCRGSRGMQMAQDALNDWLSSFDDDQSTDASAAADARHGFVPPKPTPANARGSTSLAMPAPTVSLLNPLAAPFEPSHISTRQRPRGRRAGRRHPPRVH